MKNTLLKQRTVNLAVVALVSVFGACATTAFTSRRKLALISRFQSEGRNHR